MFCFFIRRESSYIVWHKKILNHNTFRLLQESESCSSFSNICVDVLYYSYTTNIQRPIFKSSIRMPTQSYNVFVFHDNPNKNCS